MYESTGLEGHSGILIYPLGSTTPTQRIDLPPQFFGEGVINNGVTLLQWTWQSHTGFVYDRKTLKLLRTFHYTSEGWGMTRTSRELITSDGTSTLRFRNPATFAETRSILVHDGPTPIDQLNELEYIRSEIYANIWHSDRIARISPADGHVLSWIDCTGLLPASQRPTLKPSSTALPTTPGTIASSSPASSGPQSSRSKWSHSGQDVNNHTAPKWTARSPQSVLKHRAWPSELMLYTQSDSCLGAFFTRA